MMRTIISITSSKTWRALMALALLLSCLSLPASAEDARAQPHRGFRVNATVVNGLSTVHFYTPQGVVTLNLTSDLRQGDSVLATFVTQAKESRPHEREANQALLTTYTLTLGKATTSLQPQGSPWKLTIGPDGANEVILRDQQGIEVARAALTMLRAGKTDELNDRKERSSPDRFHIPSNGKAGRPLVLGGGIPWETMELHVLIGGKEAAVLAASPRNVFVMTPNDVSGKTILQIKQGDLVVYEGAYRNDRVRRTNPWPYIIGAAVVVVGAVAIGLATFHPHIHLNPITEL